ncbi:golgin subfamily A member 6-like protein 10 [Ornithodoros turicata]|uniref:golgin subfamily A member 6-like protein 10 n=1 Tax=Ornithodoros turicata TaxID=34597 RepID=UPI00313951C2
MDTDEPPTLAPGDVQTLCDYVDALRSKTQNIEREIKKSEVDVGAEDTEQGLDAQYRTAMAEYTAQELALSSLQLSNEQYKVTFEEGPSEFQIWLLKLMKENERLKQEYLEEQQKLCEEKAKLEELRQQHKRLAEERKAVEERERECEHGADAPPSEERHLKEELEKLRILNNVTLQLILSSNADWATDTELRDIVEGCSKLL